METYKLATIEKILNVTEHLNADSLELATILGWQAVIRKNEFKKGDFCIYIRIDSILPEKEEFKFLEKEKYRIRKMLIRKQPSFGLIMPLSILKDMHYELEEGFDVTSLLCIKKYEKHIDPKLRGEIKRPFPEYVPKTDEERIQNIPNVLTESIGEKVYITTKLDGTSFTAMEKDGELDVCSRNYSLKEGDTVYWRVYKKYNMNIFFKGFPNCAIQGEICGPGINKNPLNLTEIDLFVFDIYGISSGMYVELEVLQRLCYLYNFKMVPIEDITYINNSWSIDYLLNKATGLYPGTKNNKEGIVVRTTGSKFFQNINGRLSFKVINPEYND